MAPVALSSAKPGPTKARAHISCMEIETIDGLLRRAITVITELGEDLAEYDRPVDAAESELKELLLASRILKAQHNFLRDEQTRSALDEVSLEALQTEFDTVRAAIRIDWSREPDFVAFKERTWMGVEAMPAIKSDGTFATRINHDELAEFSVTGQKERFVCPITQQLFKEPVRSYPPSTLMSMMPL